MADTKVATCDWVDYVDGPHPGCAEFAPADEMRCRDAATRRMVIRSDYAAHFIRQMGGWDDYRAAVLAGMEGDGAPDPGEDPGQERWGDSEMLLCEFHAPAMREPDPLGSEPAVGGEFAAHLIVDEPID